MNPLFQAFSGGFSPMQNGMGNPAPQAMNGPFGMMQGVMQRVQQMANNLQNPQQMIQQFFPNAPAEVRNDPEQLLNWLQQSGMYTPQQVQMARSMMGGR